MASLYKAPIETRDNTEQVELFLERQKGHWQQLRRSLEVNR